MALKYDLFGACYNGDLSKVKQLVAKGVDVRVNTDEAFRIAAGNGHLHIVKYLVDENGVDITKMYDYVISWAANYGYVDVVKYIVERAGFSTTDGGRACRWAAENGHLKVVKYLVSVGADFRSYNDWACRWAVINDHLEVSKYLVSVGASKRGLSQRCIAYMEFCERMLQKNMIRAQKKIYYWWIRICYDMDHPSGCGKRMAQQNLNVYLEMCKHVL